jgi:hypothetical protein
MIPSEGKREYGDARLHRLWNLLKRVKNRNAGKVDTAKGESHEPTLMAERNATVLPQENREPSKKGMVHMEP